MVRAVGQAQYGEHGIGGGQEGIGRSVDRVADSLRYRDVHERLDERRRMAADLQTVE